MVTSDFRPEKEIRPFRVCAMKNMQYNPYFMAKLPKFPRSKQKWGQETQW